MDVVGAGAEETLGAGDLLEEEFVADAGGVAVADAQRAADAGKENVGQTISLPH
jgi:hypothetical protein